MKKTLLTLALIFTVSGCASIIEGRTQNVKLLPSKGENVDATFTSKAGTQNVKLPQTVSVEKANQELSVTVKQNTCVQPSTQTAKPSVSPWFFGNILFGGVFGSTTDAMTGSMWKYDDSVVVPISTAGNCQ